MTKIQFIVRYNQALTDNNLLHRDIVMLATLAHMATEGRPEAMSGEIGDACAEPNAAAVLRRLSANNFLDSRHDTRRHNNATHRVVFYSINQKGIETLNKVISP
jgi:hypothetical protein